MNLIQIHRHISVVMLLRFWVLVVCLWCTVPTRCEMNAWSLASK